MSQKSEKQTIFSDDIELQIGECDRHESSWCQNVQKVLIYTGVLLSVGSLVILNTLDRFYISSVMTGYSVNDDEVLFHLTQYTDNPPTMVFISFLLLLLTAQSCSNPEKGNSNFFLLTIWGLVVWCQCSYLVLLVSSIINDLALEKGLGWLLVIMCSIVLHSLLLPVSNRSPGIFGYLKSFQSWITVLGCLFELCQYSTTGMTNYILYYGAIEGKNIRNILLGLSVLHVSTLVILGLALIAVIISSSAIIEDTDDDVDGTVDSEEIPPQDWSTAKKLWIGSMFVPFIAVSVCHCYQYQWVQLVLGSQN